MSRLGKKPIPVPSGVKVEIKGQTLKIGAASYSLTLNIHPGVKVEFLPDKSMIQVTRLGEERIQKAMHGTTWALIGNMIEGVTKGYQKDMAIYGTGYGVKQQGTNLQLTLGFAKPVELPIPAGVKVDIQTPSTRGNDVPALFSIKGPDKWAVGQFAAQVRKSRPPEPYKGKGVRYANEVIKRKVGKAFGSA